MPSEMKLFIPLYRFASRLTMLRANRERAHNGKVMAQTLVPHLVNDKGVDRIKIGVKEFQCMGASAASRSPPRLSRHGA